MLFWFIFFPYLEQVVIDLESTSESITYQCYSSTPGFLYALLVFNCALLLFGCFLAIKTRKLPSNYNESKHLAFSVSTCYARLAVAHQSFRFTTLLWPCSSSCRLHQSSPIPIQSPSQSQLASCSRQRCLFSFSLRPRCIWPWTKVSFLQLWRSKLVSLLVLHSVLAY